MIPKRGIARLLPTRSILLAMLGVLLLGRMGLGCDAAFATPALPAPMDMSAEALHCSPDSNPAPSSPQSAPTCLAACTFALPAIPVVSAGVAWPESPPQIGAVHALSGVVPAPADPPPRAA
ncbi:hypothetical protein D3876_06805 [Sphingomonas cavernae]|uniref:DUF2946 domain-containing protein n=1 Tax=Sphingomonas cavernae TaxID=2320861 RepID=A0A418WRU8_9SPHN|nr:hypothetical protein D3876_06805 [Sphingomonas cavernae]